MIRNDVTHTIENNTSFSEHYRTAVVAVRAAFTKLLLSVGADPAKPQIVARRFNLNKNLTWMISKIINTTDVYSVAQYIPGPARIESALAAMKAGGAPLAAVNELREAIRGFDVMVQTHTGDRATLDMMIAELSHEDTKADQLAQSRKLAFRGLSGILGVQTRLRVTCYVLALNSKDPSMVDLVEVSGLVGFRRLRTDARWLLFRRQRWTDDEAEGADLPEVPLVPHGGAADELPLLADFCSSPIPQVDVVRQGKEIHYELPPGPVGRTAALSLLYGVVARSAGPAHRDEHNRYCELGCSLTTPTETLLFDVLVHEKLSWALRAEVLLYSRMDGDTVPLTIKRERNRLPFTETVQDLGRGLATMITPLMPDYTDLMRAVFERVGWPADEFRGLRFTIQYPPIPAIAVFRSELPERP